MALQSSSMLPSRLPLTNSSQRKLKCVTPKRHLTKLTQILALKQDDTRGHGNLVDENMIILRERIHEIKMAERKPDPPSDWMEWEKQYSANYDSDICMTMGLLQTLLMNMRPSLALGFVAVVALSVPTSMATIVCHLLEIAKNFG